MATTYMALLNETVTGDVLSAANWNKAAAGVDRQALALYTLLGTGRKTGWGITSGTSTITSGTGKVGACWCVTTAAQAVSGLVAGSTNYVFAKADAGAAASGTVDFVARSTSGLITNYDATTPAVLLGKAHHVAATGLHTIDSSIRSNWAIDHGGLAGLTHDDHSQYMQTRVVELHAANAVLPATSAAATSTWGTNFKASVIKFPALSGARAGFDFYCPPDYSGTITVALDWVSSGIAGPIRFALFARNVASAETWDTAGASCIAAAQLTISGTAGHLRRSSHAWTTAKPSINERCTLIVKRYGANASDTMSGVARLLGGRVSFPSAL